jgi:hypothetical protein
VIRGLTMILALAALAASGPLRMLHVHAYDGHDHPDHHHGPAAHSHAPAHHIHHDVGSAGDAGAESLESCDPGAHVVPVVFTCISPARPQVVAAEPAVLVQLQLPSVAPAVVAIFDTRAHSPPRLTDAPLRAPPAVDPA